MAEDTSIGAAIGGTMGLFMHGLTYQPTNTTKTSGSPDPVAETAADGGLQNATDIGQAEGGIEGRNEASRQIIKQSISPASSSSNMRMGSGDMSDGGTSPLSPVKIVNSKVAESLIADLKNDPYASAGGADKWRRYQYTKEQLEFKTRQNPTLWDPPANRRLGTDIRDAIWLLGVDRGWW